MPSLSLTTLGLISPTVRRPDYDIAQVDVGIVHLGLGAFHRAHQAMYTDDLLRADPRWGICGVSLKTPRATEPLAAQDCLYTALEKSAEGRNARVVGAVREALFLGTERAKVIARLADPEVHIVTLTVTEKGYCHDPATGRLNLGHPDISHDLAHFEVAKSAPGVLVAGLAARRKAGSGALTVVCCDNLPHNGRVVEAIVTTFAQAHDPALADWIGRHVTFPSTMVDRIVPATTAADVTEVSELLGVADAVPVVFEPFKQWVIEDRFAAARPAWEDAGAQFVADVAPFETMKLRLLNGSHSTLAYLGFLAGHEYIWQASSDPDLARLVERQMVEEIVPTLVAPPGTDLAAYCRQLMDPVSKHGAAAPDAADRDGRVAKAAAATARHDTQPSGRGRLDRASRAGRRGMDSLCKRRPTSRAGRSPCRTRWPPSSLGSPPPPRAIRHALPRGSSSSLRCSAPTFPPTRLSGQTSPAMSTRCFAPACDARSPSTSRVVERHFSRTIS